MCIRDSNYVDKFVELLIDLLHHVFLVVYNDGNAGDIGLGCSTNG